MSDTAGRTLRAEIRKVYVDTEGRNGKKFKAARFSAATADGDKFSTFDPAVGRLLQECEGKSVDLQLERNGDYENIVGVIPVAGASPTMKPRDPTESRHIARQAALKAAANIYQGAGVDVSTVLKTADRFVAWVYGEDAIEHIPNATTEEIAADRASRGFVTPARATAAVSDLDLITLFNRHTKIAGLWLVANPGVPKAIANMSSEQKAQLHAFLAEEDQKIPF